MSEGFTVSIAGLIAEKNEIVRGGCGECEGEFEVGCEFFETLGCLPVDVVGSKFNIWIEPVKIRTATAGGLVASDRGDKMLVHSSVAAALFVKEGKALGADGGEREVELFMPSVPIGLSFLLPAAQPFEAVTDVGNFVLIDFREKVSGLLVTGSGEDLGVVLRVVEVGLLEGEREA